MAQQGIAFVGRAKMAIGRRLRLAMGMPARKRRSPKLFAIGSLLQSKTLLAQALRLMALAWSMSAKVATA
jgi:hypothetical protein